MLFKILGILTVSIINLVQIPMILSSILSGFNHTLQKGFIKKNIKAILLSLLITVLFIFLSNLIINYITIDSFVVNNIIYNRLSINSVDDYKRIYISDNFFNSLVNNNILTLVLSFYIVGFAISKQKEKLKSDILEKLTESSFSAIKKMVVIVSRILPIGLIILLIYNVRDIDFQYINNFIQIVLIFVLIIILMFYITLFMVKRISDQTILNSFKAISIPSLLALFTGVKFISLPFIIKEAIDTLKYESSNVKLSTPLYSLFIRFGDVIVYSVFSLYCLKIYKVEVNIFHLLGIIILSIVVSILNSNSIEIITIPLLATLLKRLTIPTEPMYLLILTMAIFMNPVKETINTLFTFFHLSIINIDKDNNSSKRKTIPLKPLIILIFTILLLFSGGIILFQSYSFSKKNIYSLTESRMNDISQSVKGKIEGYLKPAVRVGKSISMGLVESNRVEVFKNEMDINPEFSAIYYADEMGTFIMVKRMADNTLSVKKVAIKGSNYVTTWDHENNKYIKEYPETLIEKNGYDPRIRIWYKTALENSMNSWSDIYIFNTDNLPGITNVTPVYIDGIFKGVIGIDLDISSMSIYLSSLELSQYGQIYILDKNRNIVMRTLDGEKLTEIVSINNVSDPIILEAYKSGLKRDRIISIEFNNKRYLSYYTFFDLFDQLSFSMGIIIPEDYLLAESNKNLKGLIIIGIIIIFISFLLVIVLSEKIIEPLEKLSLEFKKVRNFIFNSNYQDKVYISEIKQINSDFGRMKSGLYSFSKYIPSNVVRQLIKIGNVAIPGGDKKELTILFSDIKDFTATSELLKPEDLITQLMNYLGSLSDLIIQNQGTIDKYIGDAIMAFWGAPESDIHHAYNACHSALLCQTYLKNSSYPFEETRIGIHTGDVIVGNLGSENRLNYTVIGDNVNISSRLEGLNKYYGTKIIISSTTYNKVSNKFICRKLDRVAVKGKTQGMEIYELIREKTDEFDRDQYSELYSEAVDLFLNKDLERSRAIFNKIKDLGENTIALNKMLERFDSWSDINVFKTK